MRSLRLPDKHKYKQRIRRRRLEVCLGKLIENVRGWKVGGERRLGLQTKVIKSAALKLLSNAKVYLRQRIALLFFISFLVACAWSGTLGRTEDGG